MNRFITLPRAILLVVTLMTSGLVTALPVNAAMPSSPATQPGQGLQLSPPLVNVQADPGRSITIQIKIRNVSGGPLVISGSANDFSALGENGEPHIILDQSAPTRFSLRQWIGRVPSVTLAAQEQRTIPVKIVLPQNAEPGGHYAVIRFTGTPPSLDGTGVALSASIGTLVLLTVNGNITHKITAVDVRAQDTKGQTHSLFESAPINLIERIKNEGNVHEVPVGSIVVTNMLGKVTATLPFNDKKSNILPDSIRKFSQTLGKQFLFGRYTVSSSVTYAGGTKVTLPGSSFWVIPYKLVIGVLIALIIIILFFRVGLRSYNARIIAKSRRRR